MRTDKNIKTALAVTLALSAIAAPAASAHGQQASWVVEPNPDQQAAQIAPAASTPSETNWVVRPNPDEQSAVGTTPAVIVRTTDPSTGFDWGAAGIGAAGAVGLSAIGLAGALTITQRRTRHVRRSAGAAR